MSAKGFVDTNILLYAFDRKDLKAERARQIVEGNVCISVQVLNEFSSVCTRKLKIEWPLLNAWRQTLRVFFPSPAAITVMTHDKAAEIAERYKITFYDALILASAQGAGCNILYTEDMHHGQRVGDVTIVNPFQ